MLERTAIAITATCCKDFDGAYLYLTDVSWSFGAGMRGMEKQILAALRAVVGIGFWLDVSS
jgi:hypothetical protein